MGANRTGDFDFSPFEDDYRGFDPRDDEGGRGPLILALAVGVLLIFGSVVWNTYRQGVRVDGAGLPVIAAVQTPYKRAPEDPGGGMREDMEIRIYDQIDGAERGAAVLDAAVRETAQPGGDEEPALSGAGPRDLRPSSAIRPRQRPEPGPEIPAVAVEALPPPIVAERAPVARAPEVPASPEPRFAFDPTGDYLVQLAAFRSEDAAAVEWSRATSALPEAFIGAQKSVQRADLGARGVFYRLRAGAFRTRRDASAFCDALKAEGRACIVVAG